MRLSFSGKKVKNQTHRLWNSWTQDQAQFVEQVRFARKNLFTGSLRTPYVSPEAFHFASFET